MGFSGGKFIKSQTFLCFANLLIFIFAIVLFALNFGLYGDIIFTETEQWKVNAVEDFTAVNAGSECPSGYETISSTHPGTSDYCSKLGITYTRGTCSSKESGISKLGLRQEELYIFDDKKFCFKRSNVNYLQIYESRLEESQFDSCSSGQLECGPQDLSEQLTYCYSGEMCPVNALWMTAENTTSAQIQGSEYRFEGLFSNWDAYLVLDAQFPPLADFYINLSPPCGDPELLYTPRNGSRKLYLEGTCGFELDGSPFHPGYEATGFYASEWDVLTENSYLDNVQDKVPDWDKADFTQNYYRLYFKPYSKWSYDCSQYHPEEVSNQANTMNTVVSSTKAFFWLDLVFVCVFGVCLILLVMFKSDNDKESLKTCAYVTLALTFLSYAWLLLLLFQILSKTADLDSTQLKYYGEKECSDAYLNYAFLEISDAIATLRSMTIVTLVTLCLAILINLLAALACFKVVKLFPTKAERGPLEQELLENKEETHEEQ